MREAIRASLEAVAGIALAACIVLAGVGLASIVNREICPKSGGVCDCKYCQCSETCPGQCAKKCCEPRKAHIIHPDGTQEHRPLTPDEEEQLRPMTVEEFKQFQDELRKEIEAREK